MSTLEVKIPRVNANEDEILVTDIHCAVGDAVKRGDVLATAETTKAAIEIEVQKSGHVLKIPGKPGKMIAVGATIAVIETEDKIALENKPDAVNPGKNLEEDNAEIKITAKAKLLAKELNIDISKVPPTDHRIGIQEVQAAANAVSNGVLEEESPSSLTEMRAVIVGGGGHSATIAEIATAVGWNIVGAVDQSIPKNENVISGLDVIESDSCLQEMYDSGIRTAFIGIGGATSSTVRKEVFEKLQKIGFTLPPLVHPSAHFGADVKLGPASYILPTAMVGPRCKIGANVIVNSGSVVAHDCIVEDHVHLAPSAVLAGNVTVGTCSVVGMSATILFGMSVGASCLIHNNVSVYTCVPNNTELSLKDVVTRSKISM